MYKIATWNVNSLKVRLPHLLDWLQKHEPHILAIQETKLADELFVTHEIEALGYHVIYSGQRAYNGVAILSRSKPEEVIKDIPAYTDVQRRVLMATIDNIRIINLYVPNGESVTSEKYQYKLFWLEQIKRCIADELKKYERIVVLGDFNIAPTSQDVYNPYLWEGRVLFSDPERQAFADLLDLGLKDSFRLFPQPDKSFTFWDYRMLAFKKNQGLRIDHILINAALAEICEGCIVDKEPRKLERPSDHAPVLASFTL